MKQLTFSPVFLAAFLVAVFFILLAPSSVFALESGETPFGTLSRNDIGEIQIFSSSHAVVRTKDANPVFTVDRGKANSRTSVNDNLEYILGAGDECDDHKLRVQGGSATLEYSYIEADDSGSNACQRGEISNLPVDDSNYAQYDAFRLTATNPSGEEKDYIFMPRYLELEGSVTKGATLEPIGVFTPWDSQALGYNPDTYVRINSSHSYVIEPREGGLNQSTAPLSGDARFDAEWIVLSDLEQHTKKTKATVQHNSIDINIAPASVEIPSYYWDYNNPNLSMFFQNDDDGGDISSPNTGDSDDATDTEPTCEDGAGPLGWITCKVLSLLGSSLNFLDTVLQAMLRVPNEYMAADGVRDIWVSFRNIAYLILVPAMLIMVISTALGFEFVSAYTVKKALPRFVIAAIFIALSFDIMQFVIIFVNDISNGILGLLSNLGSGGPRSLEDLFGPSWGTDVAILSAFGIGAAGIAAAGGLSAVFSGAVFVLLGFLGAAALAVFFALLLLAFRQMLIIGLAVVAPVAILGWIFPANTKFWSLWRSSFLKLLLLYPVIVFAIGAGRLFASIIDAVDPANTLSGFEGWAIAFFAALLKLAAYVMPYFLIPFLFKTAGGVFGNLAGMMNDKERGPMDRLRNWGRKRRETTAGYVDRQTRKQSMEDSRTRRGKKRGLEKVLNSGDQEIAAGGGVVSEIRRKSRERRRSKLDDATVYGMEEQLKKEEFTAASYGLQKDTSGKSRNDTLSHLENAAKGLDANGNADATTSHAKRKAAIAMLAQQQAVEHIDRVREAGFNNQDIALSFNESLSDAQTYGLIKGASVANAEEVIPGSVSPGTSTADHMSRRRLKKFSGASDSELAGMKPGGWEQYFNDAPAEAQARLDAVHADLMMRSKLPQEVLIKYPPGGSPPAGGGTPPPTTGGGTQPPSSGGGTP